MREKLKQQKRDIYEEIRQWQQENGNTKLYIWGTGSVAAGVTEALREHGIAADGYFTDVDGAAVDSRIVSNGIEKYSLKELKEQGKNFSVVVGHSHYELAKSMESEACIERIWLLPSVTRANLHISREFVSGHIEELEKVYEKLEDEISRSNMVDFLNANITMDVEDIVRHFKEPCNYFSNDVLELSKEETYLDLGAYDGTSVENFIRQVDGCFEKIIAVEVMPEMYQYLLGKNWARRENVHLLNVGISDHVGMDYFHMDSQSTCLSENGVETAVTKIDALPYKDISVIKICIGDSIKPILWGGRETIKKEVPKMVISAGVDSKALVEYIPLIEEIAGEGTYRFYLRFTNATTDCLVLYAIPGI